VDALSEVLRLARFTAGLTLDATARAPWCVSVAASPAIARAHLVLDGECLLKAGSAEPVVLKAGELAFLPRGDAHLIGSTLDADATPLSALMKTPVAGELVPVTLGGSAAPTRWIALSASFERHLADSLIAALPPVMTVDLSNASALYWLTDALGLTLSASAAPPVGATAERARLAELAIIAAISR
jgi:AraC family transcriptional activator of mtrCDE